LKRYKNWPAHGDPAVGTISSISHLITIKIPMVFMSPCLGDYPLSGATKLYFLYLMMQIAYADTTIQKLGIEIHGMAYGYDRPDDSTLNNTLFMHYDIINRQHTIIRIHIWAFLLILTWDLPGMII
jgi:hypothetical protein